MTRLAARGEKARPMSPSVSPGSTRSPTTSTTRTATVPRPAVVRRRRAGVGRRAGQGQPVADSGGGDPRLPVGGRRCRDSCIPDPSTRPQTSSAELWPPGYGAKHAYCRGLRWSDDGTVAVVVQRVRQRRHPGQQERVPQRRPAHRLLRGLGLPVERFEWHLWVGRRSSLRSSSTRRHNRCA